MSIEAGKESAKIAEYGIILTKSGDPQIAVQFSFKQSGEDKTLVWFGTLKEGKGREITINALKTMGLDTSKRKIAEVAKGLAGGALNTEETYTVTIEMNEYQGQVKPQIRWINKPGGNIFEDAIDYGQAISMLDRLNLGAGLSTPSPSQSPEKPISDDFDIPF